MLFSSFPDSFSPPAGSKSCPQSPRTQRHPPPPQPPHPEDWRRACLSFVTLTGGIRADGAINVLEVCPSNVVHLLHQITWNHKSNQICAVVPSGSHFVRVLNFACSKCLESNFSPHTYNINLYVSMPSISLLIISHIQSAAWCVRWPIWIGNVICGATSDVQQDACVCLRTLLRALTLIYRHKCCLYTT